MSEAILQQRRRILQEKYLYSFFLQMTGIAHLPNVQEILEIGPGGGTFKLLMEAMAYRVFTADVQERFEPDYLGDFRHLCFDRKFDAVVAFEMLEHMPYEDFTPCLAKMAALSERYVYISIPCQLHVFQLHIKIPRFFLRSFLRRVEKISVDIHYEYPRPPDKDTNQPGRSEYWDPHYWECGRKSYPKRRVLNDIRSCGLRVISCTHNKVYPYHLFILCEKQ